MYVAEQAQRVLSIQEQQLLRVFQMLRELHRRGYEQLRIVPGMSASGIHYRASITFARNVRRDHGARAVDGQLVAQHSSADGDKLFAWNDVAQADIATLADRFLERFASIAREGFGPDPAYAKWFADGALAAARNGAFPIAYADYDLSSDNLMLPTTKHEDRLCMPPPGLSEKS